MKYRKKPVIIEAIRWTGLNLEEIKAFVGRDLRYDIMDAAWEVGRGTPHINMKIHTLEGDHECTKGDFIIKGVNGEFYPCKPDIFEKTYEVVNGDLKEVDRDGCICDQGGDLKQTQYCPGGDRSAPERRIQRAGELCRV